MSQPSHQPIRVSPALLALFGPVRWWRRQWASFGFKIVSVTLVSIALVLLFGTWSGCTKQNSWENWLANFRFRGMGGSKSSMGLGDSRRAMLRDMGPLPAYLGNGRAELGEYSVCVFDPITQSTLRTDFRLEGATKLGDEASFQQFMQCNGRFFREQVAVVLRTHNLDELAKPDLDLLSRKIVARVNRSLGQKVLESAKIKDFALHESIDRSSFIPFESGEDEGMP